MKLNRIDNREPLQVRVTLPASTVELLVAYTEYNPEFVDIKQLIAEICRAFTQRGDKDFALWLRTRQQVGVKTKAKQKTNGADLSVPSTMSFEETQK